MGQRHLEGEHAFEAVIEVARQRPVEPHGVHHPEELEHRGRTRSASGRVRRPGAVVREAHDEHRAKPACQAHRGARRHRPEGRQEPQAAERGRDPRRDPEHVGEGVHVDARLAATASGARGTSRWTS